METPDVTTAQKGAVAQLVAAITAAAALGLGTVEFVVVVAAAALLAACTVLADSRIRQARNFRAAAAGADHPSDDEIVDAEVVEEIDGDKVDAGAEQ